MEPIIRVKGVSKRYRVGGGGQYYGSLRESLTSSIKAPLRLLKSRRGNSKPEGKTHFWALNDVAFDVEPGEVLGLIGSNGAGKSTLLKILSRITRPTTGRVELYGRVRSLLEVGTGFHPELSGRENVFLNGAILGMPRAETARKFDEIVAFAEVEKFIDTPVKHYSSGMYVRLAFAVAAHLEPEILLVDEVLAVGDSRFHQKAVDKMHQLNQQGMTIVLVTHNMWLIQTVCTRGILLKRGQIAAEGRPQLVIDAYRRAAVELKEEAAASTHKNEATLGSIELLPSGVSTSKGEATPEGGISFRYSAHLPSDPKVKFFVRVTSTDFIPFFTVYSDTVRVPSTGRLACEVTIPRLMLHGGDYFAWVGVCSDREQEEVILQSQLPLAVRESSPHPERGIFWNRATWKISKD
jgi:ABC-type polysaccharide/polyol phosphate transport system ATPase subunit